VQHSRIVNSRDKEYNSKITIQFIKISGVISLFSILIFVIIPSEFYQYIFGDEFGAIRTAIIYLSPGVLFFSVSFIISSYFSGVGKHHINTISSIIGLFSIVVLAFILIPKYGIIGAGIAASFSYFTTTLVKVYSFNKLNTIKMKHYIPSRSDFKELTSAIKSLKEN
jgi:O-antigen/teichoic acid export membrane protein